MPSGASTSAVTILGAGRMGSALARAFRAAGHGVVVWNRDFARAQALTTIGASPCADIGQAVAASPTVVICVSDYAASTGLLEAVQDHMRGKTVVQLTTGSPNEAEAFAERLAAAGAIGLDGAIMAYPSQVGQESCRLLVSGDQSVYEHHEPLIRALGLPLFMGERAGAASAMDGALLFNVHAASFAYFQAVALLMAQGYEWRGLAALVAGNQASADSLEAWEAAIAGRTHGGSEATLDVHFAAFRSVAAAADASASRRPFLDAIEEHFERATALGHGGDELSSVFETFRPTPPS